MLIKRCTHCQRTYTTHRQDELSRVFCKPCLQHCLQALPIVAAYTQENPSVPLARIPKALGIPEAFVNALYYSGKIVVIDLTTRQPIFGKRHCSICNKLMTPQEDVYCRDCSQVIEKRLHAQYAQVALSQRRQPSPRRRVQHLDNGIQQPGF